MGDRWFWFRFHAETLDDPKVQMLPPPLFKIWVNLLCLACKHNGILPSIEDIAFALRATVSETEEAVSTLLKANLLDERKNQHGQTLTPHNWAKRQFKSDSSTERVKRFRNVARNRNVTPSESDTEQIQKRKKKESFCLNGFQKSFDQFWQTYPKKTGKGAVEKIWGKLKPDRELLEVMMAKLEIQKQSPEWAKNGGEFIPNPSTWLNQKRWLDEPMVSQPKKLRVSL